MFGYFIPANCFAAENRKRKREKVPFLSIRNERMIYTDRSRLVSNSGALPLFVREIVSKTRSSFKEINAEKSSERISKKEEFRSFKKCFIWFIITLLVTQCLSLQKIPQELQHADGQVWKRVCLMAVAKQKNNPSAYGLLLI